MGNTCSSLSENKVRIISEVYLKTKDMLFYYVYSHINNIEEAKDITHDIFLRAIYYNEELKENGIISFLFSIARNLVIDYVRHLNTRLEVDSYIFYVNENIVNDIDSNINYKDILSLEKSRIKSLPKQRRIIYIKNRFNHKTVGEIAEELSISKRTVEGHLLQGRKQVRDYIRRCI